MLVRWKDGFLLIWKVKFTTFWTCRIHVFGRMTQLWLHLPTVSAEWCSFGNAFQENHTVQKINGVGCLSLIILTGMMESVEDVEKGNPCLCIFSPEGRYLLMDVYDLFWLMCLTIYLKVSFPSCIFTIFLLNLKTIPMNKQQGLDLPNECCENLAVGPSFWVLGQLNFSKEFNNWCTWETV